MENNEEPIIAPIKKSRLQRFEEQGRQSQIPEEEKKKNQAKVREMISKYEELEKEKAMYYRKREEEKKRLLGEKEKARDEKNIEEYKMYSVQIAGLDRKGIKEFLNEATSENGFSRKTNEYMIQQTHLRGFVKNAKAIFTVIKMESYLKYTIPKDLALEIFDELAKASQPVKDFHPKDKLDKKIASTVIDGRFKAVEEECFTKVYKQYLKDKENKKEAIPDKFVEIDPEIRKLFEEQKQKDEIYEKIALKEQKEWEKRKEERNKRPKEEIALEDYQEYSRNIGLYSDRKDIRSYIKEVTGKEGFSKNSNDYLLNKAHLVGYLKHVKSAFAIMKMETFLKYTMPTELVANVYERLSKAEELYNKTKKGLNENVFDNINENVFKKEELECFKIVYAQCEKDKIMRQEKGRE